MTAATIEPAVSPEPPLRLFSPAPRPKAPVTIISNGSGQDSTALIVRIALDRDVRRDLAPQDLVVVGSDTGNEHPETYAHIEWLRRFCATHGIEFHFLTSNMGYHSASWQDLESQWNRNHCIGSKNGFRRSCTDNLKIAPLYNFVEQTIPQRYGIVDRGAKRGMKKMAARFGLIDVIIGFTADETSRLPNAVDRAGEPEFMQISVNRRYPLIEWGWTRAEVQAYLRSVGAPIPVPSQCMMCHFKSKVDLVIMHRKYPDALARWIVHEEHKLAKFAGRNGKNHGVFGAKTLPEVVAEAIAEHVDWTDDALHEYRMSHGHCISNKI